MQFGKRRGHAGNCDDLNFIQGMVETACVPASTENASQSQPSLETCIVMQAAPCGKVPKVLHDYAGGASTLGGYALQETAVIQLSGGHSGYAPQPLKTCHIGCP